MSHRINIDGILYERVLKNKISKWKTESFDLSTDIEDTFNEFRNTLRRSRYDVEEVFRDGNTIEFIYYLGRKATTEVSFVVRNIDDSRRTRINFVIDTREDYKEIRKPFDILKVLKKYFDMDSSIDSYDNGMNIGFNGDGVPTLKSLIDFHNAFLKAW